MELCARADTPDPPTAGRPEEEYYQRVAKVHESGGYGSIGYRAPFSRDDSERLLLRTHTTAVSTNMLYQIANQPGGFKPAKLFSIDRVFRSVLNCLLLLTSDPELEDKGVLD